MWDSRGNSFARTNRARWSYEAYLLPDGQAQSQSAFTGTSTFVTGDSAPQRRVNVNQHMSYRQQRSSWQQDSRSREVSISSARASVMVYDDVNKKWIPSGSSSGLSKVQLYHHQVNNTFRVVGRKLQDHEIVINCAILKGLKYNQATVTFHQWRDNKQVYGLNFSSKDDADAFARAMLQALDVLSNGSNISRSLAPTTTANTQQQTAYQQQQQQQQQQSQATAQYDEDMGYSQGRNARISLSLSHLPTGGQTAVPVGSATTTPEHHVTVSGAVGTVIQVGCARGSPGDGHSRTMTREDVAIIQERRMSQQSQATGSPNPISPSCPSATQQQQQQQQQQQSGHHRTSSAPPAPQPPQQQSALPGGMITAPQMSAGPGVVGPPIPPPQPPIAPPAPPCPPTMMNFNSSTAPAPSMMMNQYAQSPSSQSNLANQQSQCQSIYVANQVNQYGAAPASNQYASATVPSSSSGTGSGAASVVGQSPNQFPPSGSQNNFYGTNSQTSNYTAGGSVNASQYGQSIGSQAAQYGSSGSNQYGSNSSINQYAAGPSPGPASQYSVAQSSQSQYGTNIVSQAQAQYGSASQVQAAATAGTTNPYGTPLNSVNQYTTGGHHTVSANAYAPIASSGPPPPPMVSLAGPAAPPPPPPPPVPNANSSTTAAGSGSSVSSSNDPPPDTNSLAAALQARLKKKQQQSQPVENSGSSTSSSGSGGGNYGTLGRGGGGGMASMMDEMAKTLARRRAAAEKKQPEQPPEPESSPDKKSWDKNNASNNKFSNGAESPKSVRKRFGSASEDTLLKVNGVNDGTSFTAQEMEAFKVEIIKEVRKEFQKMKQEIIDAVRTELNKR